MRPGGNGWLPSCQLEKLCAQLLDFPGLRLTGSDELLQCVAVGAIHFGLLSDYFVGIKQNQFVQFSAHAVDQTAEYGRLTLTHIHLQQRRLIGDECV